MAEITEKLVIAAGDRLGDIIKERFKTYGKEIAGFLNHQKQQNDGKEVSVTLGAITVETEGTVLNVRYKCKLKRTKDISSGIATVSADEKLPGMEETAGEKPPEKAPPKKK